MLPKPRSCQDFDLQAPAARRFIGVWDDSGSQASWQSGLVVCAAPKGSVGKDTLHYTRGEVLGRIDDTGRPTDWAIRATVHPRAVAARENRKATRRFSDQLDHTSEAGASHTGRLLKLDEGAAVLADSSAETEMDDKAIETRPLIMLSTSAVDGPTASVQAHEIMNSPIMEKLLWPAQSVPKNASFGRCSLVRGFRCS